MKALETDPNQAETAIREIWECVTFYSIHKQFGSPHLTGFEVSEDRAQSWQSSQKMRGETQKQKGSQAQNVPIKSTQSVCFLLTLHTMGETQGDLAIKGQLELPRLNREFSYRPTQARQVWSLS